MLIGCHGSAADDAFKSPKKWSEAEFFSGDLVAQPKASGYNGAGWFFPMCGQGGYQELCRTSSLIILLLPHL